jgi:glucosamine--fructose-6-phosphate aminotransferase (isomerizing)
VSTEHFDAHVARQPETIARLVASDIPGLDPGRPIIFSGIGTSLHACQVAAGWVRWVTNGLVRPTALDAHELALNEPLTGDDQVVVVSHRGTKQRPNEVLARARSLGATTVAITGEGQVQPVADLVLRTCAQERASTHTESYTSALATLAGIVTATFPNNAAPLREALRNVPEAMAATLSMPLADAAVAALASAGHDTSYIVGTGLDEVSSREAALKVKEGTYRAAEGLHTEFAVHGTPAVFRASTVAYLVEPAGDDAGRTDELAGLLARLGSLAFRVGESAGSDLRFAHVPTLVRPFVTVLPFQLLVSAVAREVGSSPDMTHLEAEPWASAIRDVKL